MQRESVSVELVAGNLITSMCSGAGINIGIKITRFGRVINNAIIKQKNLTSKNNRK